MRARLRGFWAHAGDAYMGARGDGRGSRCSGIVGSSGGAPRFGTGQARGTALGALEAGAASSSAAAVQAELTGEGQDELGDATTNGCG